MTDDDLSTAVVLYVWGDRSEPWPSERPEAVLAQLGDVALDLVPQVQRIMPLLDSRPGDGESLEAATARIEQLVRTQYPDLTDEAVTALGTLYYFGWK